MCRNHRFFEGESKGHAQNYTGYDLRCQNLEHCKIIHRRGVVEHENERHEQGVCYNRRKGCKKRSATQKVRADRTYERCKRAKNHVEHAEGREKEVCEKTTYCKPGDRFGEDEGEQHEYFGYAKLHGAERYCVECYGQGKIQSGNHSRSCQINKRFFQNTPRFFLLMGIADTIESMVSYKNRKRNRKANITMIKNAKNA